MSIVPGRDIPEAPEGWIDAVNARINDENHDDLCGCRAWPGACPHYKPGQWDEGMVLHIAAAVLEPLIRVKVLAELGLSSWWALWSETVPPRLLDLITYDTGPVTEAQARTGLGQAVVPLTGTLEAIDQTRLNELRAAHPDQQGARPSCPDH